VKYRLNAGAIRRIATITIIGFLAACEFEEDLVPVDWQIGNERRSGDLSSRPDTPEEATQSDVDRLVNELFNPYNLPGDQEYEGSKFEQADMILKDAYAHYGYDLDELAILGQDNPLTEQMFLDYLVSKNLTLIKDPATGEDWPVYDWLVSGTIGARGGVNMRVLDRIGGVDSMPPMNYERNYLAALHRWHIKAVLDTRKEFRAQLKEHYGVDAAEVYEYLETVDSFGPE